MQLARSSAAHAAVDKRPARLGSPPHKSSGVAAWRRASSRASSMRCVALALPRHLQPVRSTSPLTSFALGPSLTGAADTYIGGSSSSSSSSSTGTTHLGRPIREDMVRTRYVAETMLPTRHGNFRLRGYKHSIDGGKTFVEPTAIICGQVEGREDVVVRVHDACFTSEVLGSLKCDCAEQLQMAMEYIHDNAPGIVIYLWQEGRGIGLANKIAAYKLQEQGLDTVDANRALGLPDDLREYTSVRNILKELDVKSIKLLTNNPRKINVLTDLGVKVTGRVPCQVQAGDHNQGYIEAKAQRMAHMIDESFYSSGAVVPPPPPAGGSSPGEQQQQQHQQHQMGAVRSNAAAVAAVAAVAAAS